MSSYPPTPAFGVFSFGPPSQQYPVIPNATAGQPGASLVSPLEPPTSDKAAGPSSFASQPQPLHHQHPDHQQISRLPPVLASAYNHTGPFRQAEKDGNSSDSMEEGEVSDAEERASLHPDSVSMGSGLRHSGEPDHPSPDDAPQSGDPQNYGDKNQRFRPKQPHPARTFLPPQPVQNGPRTGPSDRSFDPPSQPRGKANDRGRAGFNRRGGGNNAQNGPNKNGQHGGLRSSNQKQANTNGYGRQQGHQPSNSRLDDIRKETEGAVQDLIRFNLQFNDIVQEAGVDPNHLMKLFAGLGMPLPEDARAPGQPDRHGVVPGQREPVNLAGQTPTVKPDTDKQANLLRERLKKERHDKQQREKEAREKEAREKQREAELKAAALAKEREAAIAEEMRQKRAVDVETARDAARKKISTMVPQKTQSPSVPPTPISSTPVLAATLRASAPHIPLAISIPPHPMIPGLFLTQNGDQQPDTQRARTDNDVVMTPTVPASSTSSSTPRTGELPSAAPSNQPTTARRKRPVASDMYSEPNQVKRIAFGAKRTQSLIIEVSDDEDIDAEQTTKERQTPPSLSRTVSEVGNVARRNNVPQSSTSNNAQSNALLQKEIEIQQMKEKLKSMQESRKRKNGTSARPTPTVTPTVGAGPTVPPPLNAAAQSFTPHSAGQKPPGGSIGKEDNHVLKVVEEQVEANAVKEQKKKVQTLLNEREQLAKQVEEKKKQEKAQEDLKIQEKEKKRKQMSAFDTSYEEKRKAMEALKAQMDKIQREQQEMEERKRLLAEELQALEHTKKVREDVPNDDVEMESNQDGDKQRQDEVEPVQTLPSDASPVPDAYPIASATGSVETTSSDNDLVMGESDSSELPEPFIERPKPGPTTVRTPTPTLPIQSDQDEMDLDAQYEPGDELPPVLSEKSASAPQPSPTVEERIDSSSAESSSESSEESSGSSSEEEESDEGEMSDEEKISDEEEEEDSESDDEAPSKTNDQVQPPPELAAVERSPTPELSQPGRDISIASDTNPQQAATPSETDAIEITQEAKAEPAIENVFTEYVSPLAVFKSFRYRPHFRQYYPAAGIKSITFSKNLDPMKLFCRYETGGGVCNDRSCSAQHFRDLDMGDDEILVELAETQGDTEQEKAEYSTGLRNAIMEMRAKEIRDFDTVAEGILKYRAQWLADKQYEPIAATQNQPSHDFSEMDIEL